jgi:hypothetical protein
MRKLAALSVLLILGCASPETLARRAKEQAEIDARFEAETKAAEERAAKSPIRIVIKAVVPSGENAAIQYSYQQGNQRVNNEWSGGSPEMELLLEPRDGESISVSAECGVRTGREYTFYHAIPNKLTIKIYMNGALINKWTSQGTGPNLTYAGPVIYRAPHLVDSQQND